jgi:hypothetical protein
LSIVECKHCREEFNVPPSRVWRSNFCSDSCRQKEKQTLEAVKKAERARVCLQCNKQFTPRLYQIKTGAGKYCSKPCRNKAVLQLLLTPQAKQKSKETYKKNLADGLIDHPKGELHPRWKGGEKATIAQAIKDGRRGLSVKKYRAKNPDKVREWSTTRLSRKTGRLPNGTVKSIGERQQWLCVYCKCDVSQKYHVDHIVPLAKGGNHVPENIQILCPSCNVRKSSKLNYSPY